MKKRVVITGIGVATPIGCEKKKFWENLCSGKSSISDLHLKGLEECYSQKYGLLDPEEVQQLEAKLLADAEQNLSKCSKLALVTAIQAVQDANISFDTLEEQLRTGVFFGTTQSDQYAFTEELEDLPLYSSGSCCEALPPAWLRFLQCQPLCIRQPCTRICLGRHPKRQTGHRSGWRCRCIFYHYICWVQSLKGAFR